MAREPWFKFFPSDFLLDAKIDSLCLEAQAVLLRMWCICHIEESCPASPEEVARKTRLSEQSVLNYWEQLSGFFTLRDGRLYSYRMEEEKQKSEAARASANRRWDKRNANRNAECNAQSQSQSQENAPPPSKEEVFDLSLQKKKSKGEFSQSDFDGRDMRLMRKAQEKFDAACRASAGTRLPEWMYDERQVFTWICREAGITVQRGLALEERQREWPEEKLQACEASA